jgi:nitrite reductase/ring-hydroxylating ferredoxin subunit
MIPAVSEFTDVASTEELPEGKMLGVVLPNGEPVCVFNHRGDIGAVSDMCTHALFRLSQGTLHPDGTLECVWHGARFDCHTGAVKRHPAPAPVPVFEVRVEDGRVLVGGQLEDDEEEEQAS